jgi:hypothetical protein
MALPSPDSTSDASEAFSWHVNIDGSALGDSLCIWVWNKPGLQARCFVIDDECIESVCKFSKVA